MMLLQRMTSLPMFGDLRREMDRLLEDCAVSPKGGFFAARGVFPAINVWEDGDRLYAEADLPGVKMEDLEVSVVGDELSLKGVRKITCEGEHAYHRQERGTGEFSRCLTLPVAVNAEKVEAVLKDGVLTITMPKHPETRTKRITVRNA